MKCYIMQHRGSLEEALKTRKRISVEEFYFLLHSYEFNCYDERIHCYRYILKNFDDLDKNLSMWLLVKLRKK